MTLSITLALAAAQIDAGAAAAEPSCPAVVLAAPPARRVTLVTSDLPDWRGPRLELQLGSTAEEVIGFGTLKLVRLSDKTYAGGVLGRRVDEQDQHWFTLSFEREQLAVLASATDIELVSETEESLRFLVTPIDPAPVKECLATKAVPASPMTDPLTRRSFTFVPLEPNQPLRLRHRFNPSSHYPAKALQEGREGTSRVALTIGASGRITECTVVVSSGHADLDAASCRAVRSSVFLPETNWAGDPVAVKREQMLQWKIGE
jgi:periplasmic protein TonB